MNIWGVSNKFRDYLEKCKKENYINHYERMDYIFYPEKKILRSPKKILNYYVCMVCNNTYSEENYKKHIKECPEHWFDLTNKIKKVIH